MGPVSNFHSETDFSPSPLVGEGRGEGEQVDFAGLSPSPNPLPSREGELVSFWMKTD
jgi:hypothetical protein